MNFIKNEFLYFVYNDILENKKNYNFLNIEVIIKSLFYYYIENFIKFNLD